MPSTATLARQQPLPATRNALVALLVKALRPLVMLMLKHGMTAYEFSEISRWVFAHAAMDRRFAVSGRDVWSMTKSRAAVLTGLTRREVDRLLAMRTPAVEDARNAFHRSARILAAWAEEDGYQDLNGRPRDLPVKGPRGSLDWLVRHYCRDIPIRAMLDELEDRGCVMRLEGERVRFLHGEIGGPEISTQALDALAGQAGSFMALVESQLADAAQPLRFLEISAGPVAPEHQDALAHRISETIQSFATQMNRDLVAQPKALIAGDNSRMVVGFYSGYL